MPTSPRKPDGEFSDEFLSTGFANGEFRTRKDEPIDGITVSPILKRMMADVFYVTVSRRVMFYALKKDAIDQSNGNVGLQTESFGRAQMQKCRVCTLGCNTSPIK